MTTGAVLHRYFGISGVFTLSASLIWGVNTLFLLQAGLDIFGVFVAGAAFTAGNVLFEIPTGVLADTVGRRASLLVSAAILCAGTFAYVAIPHGPWTPLAPFVVASLGLGLSFYSGALEAWLVDALDASGFDGNLDAVFSRGAIVSGAAMLVGTLGGGLLGQLDLGLPFLARSALLAMAFAIALLGLADLGFRARPARLRDELPRGRRDHLARDPAVPRRPPAARGRGSDRGQGRPTQPVRGSGSGERGRAGRQTAHRRGGRLTEPWRAGPGHDGRSRGACAEIWARAALPARAAADPLPGCPGPRDGLARRLLPHRPARHTGRPADRNGGNRWRGIWWHS